jgi:hypothetical protein
MIAALPKLDVAAGGIVVMTDPLLTDEAGTSPDLVLHWNDMSAATRSVDLVLHLHGYSTAAERMNLAVEKLPISGLDFGDPDRPIGATPARFRPTLCILPRGRYFGGHSGFGYDFPVLVEPPGVSRLVRDARARFRRTTGLRAAEGRRILTVHSGGGAALMQVAAQFGPHEIHVFDGLYASKPLLSQWAAAMIATDARALRRGHLPAVSAYMERSGHALRVFYIPGAGTEAASLEVDRTIQRALAAEHECGRLLAPWYRVEPVAIEHLQIPRVLGWLLLTDAGAALL